MKRIMISVGRADIVRIGTSLSMIFAQSRQVLADLDAGDVGAIGLNSPRISSGASIFRSNMSWCGGPPARKIMMTALCDLRMPGEFLRLKQLWKRKPAQRKARRS